MTYESSKPDPQAPEQEYGRRLEGLRADLARFRKRGSILGYTKLAILALGVIAIVWIVTSSRVSIYWVLVPILAFVSLEAVHSRVSTAIEMNARAQRFYERGLDRIHDRWAGKGEAGERFGADSHPYARDLDLFGNGGLFQLLCEARTNAGQEELANWLLAPAAPDEVCSRNAAVSDLRGRIGLREDIAVLSEDLRTGIRPNLLADWAEGEPAIGSAFMRVAAAFLGAAWLASLFAWIVWGVLLPPRWVGRLFVVLVVISIINAAVKHAYRRWIEALPHAEEACQGLPLLAKVMARFEREDFSTPKLVDLQARLCTQGEAPSRAIKRLARLVDWLESSRNLIVEFLDHFVFYRLQTAFAIEAWRTKFGGSVRAWVDAVGELEALSSLGAYAYEHPRDVFPEFTVEAPSFEARDFAHPLMPIGRAIRNDIALGGDLRLMIISGPNMAGKSTFLRAVGLNAVLAQCGAPVRARSLRLSPLSVAASVCVLDSLQGGISRFYAEILRVKMTIDLARSSVPVLFLLDELLGGTNSQDRRAGSQKIVKILVDRGAIGLITTHDLALAEIADALGPRAGNFHFEDRVEEGKLRFDYRLSPGVVRTSNALQLMRSIGIEI